MLSCRLAPRSVRPSGVPRASTTRWRLLPGRPLSVGLGPVSSPPFSPARTRCRGRPGSSPGRRRRAAAPAARDAVLPRHRQPASAAGAASTSCRSSPARLALLLTACPCAAPEGCQPTPPGPRREAVRPSASHVQAAEAAQQQSRGRREQQGSCPINPRRSVSSPALSHALRSRSRSRSGTSAASSASQETTPSNAIVRPSIASGA